MSSAECDSLEGQSSLLYPQSRDQEPMRHTVMGSSSVSTRPRNTVGLKRVDDHPEHEHSHNERFESLAGRSSLSKIESRSEMASIPSEAHRFLLADDTLATHHH